MSAFARLPLGHYGAIMVDPPWRFETWTPAGEDRSPSQHYELMTLDDIKRLPVSDLARPDCALFLWAVNSMLPQALATIRAWGFTFKTVAFDWAKQNPSGEGWHFGLGYWTRQNTELCLLATIGNPQRRSMAEPQLVVAPRREHSRKPDIVAERIERLVAGPYLELFARAERRGWTTWGHEVGKFEEPQS